MAASKVNGLIEGHRGVGEPKGQIGAVSGAKKTEHDGETKMNDTGVLSYPIPLSCRNESNTYANVATLRMTLLARHVMM